MQPARPDSAKIPSRPAMPTASWPCAPRPPRRSCALLRPLFMKPDLIAFCDPKIASRRGLDLAAFVLAADILLRTGTRTQLRMRPSKIDARAAIRSLFNICFQYMLTSENVRFTEHVHNILTPRENDQCNLYQMTNCTKLYTSLHFARTSGDSPQC